MTEVVSRKRGRPKKTEQTKVSKYYKFTVNGETQKFLDSILENSKVDISVLLQDVLVLLEFQLEQDNLRIIIDFLSPVLYKRYFQKYRESWKKAQTDKERMHPTVYWGENPPIFTTPPTFHSAGCTTTNAVSNTYMKPDSVKSENEQVSEFLEKLITHPEDK